MAVTILHTEDGSLNRQADPDAGGYRLVSLSGGRRRTAITANRPKISPQTNHSSVPRCLREAIREHAVAQTYM